MRSFYGSQDQWKKTDMVGILHKLRDGVDKEQHSLTCYPVNEVYQLALGSVRKKDCLKVEDE